MKHDQIEEFFVWDETNLVEPQNNCDDKIKNDHKDITDPKLRRKAYIKAYCAANKEKKKAYNKAYCAANLDKIKARKKAYYKVNPDKYYESNKDKIKAQRKLYRDSNKDKIRDRDKAYNKANKDKHKAWREANRDKINASQKKLIKTNIQYKLSCRLRTRLYSALQGNIKNGSAVTDLGCSIDELKMHLESKFQCGMISKLKIY